MGSRCLLALVSLLAFVVPSKALATGIEDLPGLVGAEVCVVGGPSLILCTGLSQAQLALPGLHPTALSNDEPISLGLTDASGGPGDEFLTLYLPGANGGSPYVINSVYLQFDSNRLEVPSSISLTANVKFSGGEGPTDLAFLTEPLPNGNSIHYADPSSGTLSAVSILSGGLVFGFASVPEPNTLVLLFVGIVGLGARGIQWRARIGTFGARSVE